MKRLHVAVGVIFNRAQEVCIARRPEGKHLAGLWEFPGGKVEAGESVFAALKRELYEELAITIQDASPLIKIDFQYPEKLVCLDVYTVDVFSGVAEGRELQEVRWVKKSELRNYHFPEANVAILNAILEQDAE